MVEWPKAERYRGQAQKAAVGKRVKSVKFLFAPGSTKDMCFFDGKASEAQMLAFAATIVGKMLEAMCRKGKQLWAVFEGGINVLLHFGLCGKVVFKRAGAQCAWPPYRTKMDITFTDSSSMAFCDTSMQKAARIRVLRGDPTTQPPICGLAPDPVLDGLDVATVTAGFARTSTSVLEILKEQQKSRGAVMCGAGKLFARVVRFTPSDSRTAHTFFYLFSLRADLAHGRRH